jgi:hypothetical protein
MEKILFGNDRPKLSFTQRPSGSLNVEIENDTVLSFQDGLPTTITWAEFAAQMGPPAFSLATTKYGSPEAAAAELENKSEKLKNWVGHLFRVVGSEEEKRFLELYLKACLGSTFGGIDKEIPNAGPWLAPALIPQVWVNWIHYDSKDEERAERRQKEPFRVDFMLKDSEIQEDPIIIEVDGASHFGNYYTDPAGELTLEASMEGYTQHLKKDRWLRDKGWSVYRISSLEVQRLDEVSDFGCFYEDLFGKYIGDLPFYTYTEST